MGDQFQGRTQNRVDFRLVMQGAEYRFGLLEPAAMRGGFRLVDDPHGGEIAVLPVTSSLPGMAAHTNRFRRDHGVSPVRRAWLI